MAHNSIDPGSQKVNKDKILQVVTSKAEDISKVVVAKLATFKEAIFTGAGKACLALSAVTALSSLSSIAIFAVGIVVIIALIMFAGKKAMELKNKNSTDKVNNEDDVDNLDEVNNEVDVDDVSKINVVKESAVTSHWKSIAGVAIFSIASCAFAMTKFFRPNNCGDKKTANSDVKVDDKKTANPGIKSVDTPKITIDIKEKNRPIDVKNHTYSQLTNLGDLSTEALCELEEIVEAVRRNTPNRTGFFAVVTKRNNIAFENILRAVKERLCPNMYINGLSKDVLSRLKSRIKTLQNAYFMNANDKQILQRLCDHIDTQLNR